MTQALKLTDSDVSKPKVLSIKGVGSKKPIDYETLLAYTDRSQKRSVLQTNKEDSLKKYPLTARDTARSTQNIARPKENEYTLGSQPLAIGFGSGSTKKIQATISEGISLTRKKLSLQGANNQITEKIALTDRPLTGSHLASGSNKSGQGAFMKKSTLPTSQRESQNRSKDGTLNRLFEKQSPAAISARTYKPPTERGTLFSSIHTEYNRKVSATNLGKIPENGRIMSASKNGGFSGKSSKIILESHVVSKNNLNLKDNALREGNLHFERGSLTDRRYSKENKQGMTPKKSNDSTGLYSPRLVQGSKFIKHLKKESNLKDSPLTSAGSKSSQKMVKKKIEISGDRSRVKSNKLSAENLRLEQTRKSAAAVAEYGQPERPKAKINTNLDKIKITRGKSKSLLSEFNARVYRRESGK